MATTVDKFDEVVVKVVRVQGELYIGDSLVSATAIADVTASAAELNILDGATLSTEELNILDGVTSTAAELNILDGVTATAAELNTAADMSSQTLTGDGAITNKNGTVVLNKAGVIAATLANPTATTDDYKKLVILSLTAQAHTVTVTGGFGNGGSGKDVATFGGAAGDCLTVMAYQGYWYVIGANGVTLA